MSSIKYIIGAIIIIIIVIAGLYFIFNRPVTVPVTTSTATSTAATSTADQVQGQDVSVGTGAEATPGSQVSVLYVGYVGTISTSTIFDSSSAHGNQPLTFCLGSQNLIPGFQIGINGMKVGGERLIAIPPSLGYGSTAVHQNPQDDTSPVVIPANSTLIFDVKLTAAQPGTSSTCPTGTATSTPAQ